MSEIAKFYDFMNSSEYEKKRFITNNKEYVLIKDVRYETDLLLNLYWYSVCKGVELLKAPATTKKTALLYTNKDMFIVNFVKESYNNFIKLRSLLP